ncbi:hypothetical protein BJ684DRAFT_21210 [Piptocephalis cylindrospora]|uniref:MPN domain-containing protein n=1 Tax=Piptocephalis cylindrospora TaxID=1907219 RepID=A0A4P9Y0I2_9FUNG|nr:hypothetical protein BJ684DRAFT_21210 [Piptocephalis cylindrospora]|eukprot:RKP12238.1 hypothetical protein BJ684DRAFT_21210 [Piptocephalis cylindrospora]
MPQYTLSHKAYLKMALHAAKHPALAVDGLLLGTMPPSATSITVTDALPLRHHHLSLSTVLDTGMTQAEMYAKEQQVRILGYYYVPSSLTDRSLPKTGEAIAKAIHSSCPHAIALVLDNTKLSAENPNVAPIPFIYVENQWRSIKTAFTSDPSPGNTTTFTLEDKSSPALAAVAISAEAYEALWDLDDHLEDLSRDWLCNSTALSLSRRG